MSFWLPKFTYLIQTIGEMQDSWLPKTLHVHVYLMMMMMMMTMMILLLKMLLYQAPGRVSPFN